MICVSLPRPRLFLGGDSSYHITSCQGFMSWQPHYTPHTSHHHTLETEIVHYLLEFWWRNMKLQAPLLYSTTVRSEVVINSLKVVQWNSQRVMKNARLEDTVFRQCKAWNVELKTDWCIKTLMISDNIPPESHILLWQICGRCSGVSDWLRRGQVIADWANIGCSGSEWQMCGRGGEVTQPNI